MKFLLACNIYLNKRRSKVEEKNMSYECALNFDQRKTFSGNYKPMRLWLWLVYKITENYYRSRLFSEFIQTQKRYTTSLDNIRYPNLKTTCHIKVKFFVWTKLLENLLQAKHFISVAAPLNNQITWSAHLFLKKELDDGNMNSSQWWIICFTDPEMDTDCKVKCEPLPCWLCPRKNQKCKSFVIIP